MSALHTGDDRLLDGIEARSTDDVRLTAAEVLRPTRREAEGESR